MNLTYNLSISIMCDQLAGALMQKENNIDNILPG